MSSEKSQQKIDYLFNDIQRTLMNVIDKQCKQFSTLLKLAQSKFDEETAIDSNMSLSELNHYHSTIEKINNEFAKFIIENIR